MNKSPDQLKTFYAKDRKSWRNWLQKNHTKEYGVWLIYNKKSSGKPVLPYAEAVEEALCFGWIDSRPQKLDDERTMLKFSVRKPKSMWSALNKKRVKQLIADGLMTPAGMAKIEEAKKNGSWETLVASDTHAEAGTMPDDLKKAFAKNKRALKNFTAFAPSYRKQFLFWIGSAKQPSTRAARIKQTLAMAAANVKPGPKGFKL